MKKTILLPIVMGAFTLASLTGCSNRDQNSASDNDMVETQMTAGEQESEEESAPEIGELFRWIYNDNQASLLSLSTARVASQDARLLMALDNNYSSKNGLVIAFSVVGEDLKRIQGYTIKHTSAIGFTSNQEPINSLLAVRFDNGDRHDYQAFVDESGAVIGIIDPDEAADIIKLLKKSETCSVFVPIVGVDTIFDFYCADLKWN